MIILVAFLSCIYIVMPYNYINVLIAFLAVINIMYGPPRSENESRIPREPETSGAGEQ